MWFFMPLVGMVGISYIFSMGRIAGEKKRHLGLVSAAETNIVIFFFLNETRKSKNNQCWLPFDNKCNAFLIFK